MTVVEREMANDRKEALVRARDKVSRRFSLIVDVPAAAFVNKLWLDGRLRLELSKLYTRVDFSTVSVEHPVEHFQLAKTTSSVNFFPLPFAVKKFKRSAGLGSIDQTSRLNEVLNYSSMERG